VAVVGSVGAGKSSLISAVLGEMEKLRGDVSLKVGHCLLQTVTDAKIYTFSVLCFCWALARDRRSPSLHLLGY